jgi:hypothetical protein
MQLRPQPAYIGNEQTLDPLTGLALTLVCPARSRLLRRLLNAAVLSILFVILAYRFHRDCPYWLEGGVIHDLRVDSNLATGGFDVLPNEFWGQPDLGVRDNGTSKNPTAIDSPGFQVRLDSRGTLQLKPVLTVTGWPSLSKLFEIGSQKKLRRFSISES